MQNHPQARAERALKTNIIDLPVLAAATCRGRPPKPALNLRPCRESFDVVADGVITLAAQAGAWAAAKERLRSRADREKAFAPATPKVLGYLLEHINGTHGFDCHSAKTMADELGITIRTVERSFKELGDAGYILRRHKIIGGTKASKKWETTLPGLLVATPRVGAPTPSRGPDNNLGKDPTEKAETRGPDKKCMEGPDEHVGQSFREENTDNGSNARTRASHDNAGNVHAFRGGKRFEEPERCAESTTDPITTEHFERFRLLADTFGRRPGAMQIRPTERSESDPLLIDLVATELGGDPPDIIRRALSAAFRTAAGVCLRDNQDGTAGNARGGMPSLLRYLHRTLRYEADAMRRAPDETDARKSRPRARFDFGTAASIKGGSPRDTSEPFEDYKARMIREGLYSEVARASTLREPTSDHDG